MTKEQEIEILKIFIDEKSNKIFDKGNEGYQRGFH